MSSSPSRPTPDDWDRVEVRNGRGEVIRTMYRASRHRPYHDDPRWKAARDRLRNVVGLDKHATALRQAACDDMVLIEIEYGFPHG